MAETRLNSIVNSALRRVLGNVTVLAVLSDERARIMTDTPSGVYGLHMNLQAPIFLRTDTHWTPYGAEVAAQ